MLILEWYELDCNEVDSNVDLAIEIDIVFDICQC